MRCSYCDGPLVHLGNLGNLSWYRCRDCGMDQSKHGYDDDDILEALENPKEAKCKVCRKTVRQRPGRGRPKLTHDRCKGKTRKSSRPARKTSKRPVKRPTKKGKAKPARKSPRKSPKAKPARAAGGRVTVQCVEDNKGKLRVRVVSPGYDHRKNVQFPRELRIPGACYTVERLVDRVSHYSALGNIEPGRCPRGS